MSLTPAGREQRPPKQPAVSSYQQDLPMAQTNTGATEQEAKLAGCCYTPARAPGVQRNREQACVTRKDTLYWAAGYKSVKPCTREG